MYTHSGFRVEKNNIASKIKNEINWGKKNRERERETERKSLVTKESNHPSHNGSSILNYFEMSFTKYSCRFGREKNWEKNWIFFSSSSFLWYIFSPHIIIAVIISFLSFFFFFSSLFLDTIRFSYLLKWVGFSCWNSMDLAELPEIGYVGSMPGAMRSSVYVTETSF